MIHAFVILAIFLPDPFCAAITQFIIEQKLEGQEVEEVMKIAGVLRQIGEGNPPDFGSHSLNSIEFILGKEISPIGRKMLEEKFNIAMSPPCCVLDSGMGLINECFCSIVQWYGTK